MTITLDNLAKTLQTVFTTEADKNTETASESSRRCPPFFEALIFADRLERWTAPRRTQELKD
jgi:hypothetical protein